jgi:hypothetical protein
MPFGFLRAERCTYVGFVAEADGRVVVGAGAVLLDWGPTRSEASGTRAQIVNVFTRAAPRGLPRDVAAHILERHD